MIQIDGSYGEGGGQILRTSLSLATITNQPIRIDRIRAGRKKPGLAAQHLTAVRAAATICNAEVRGDALGSMALEFVPGTPVEAGEYTFDVTEAQSGGSAGTVALVLQTILLPLALSAGDSRVILRGGTHIAHSPSFTYIEQVYLPMLTQLGFQAEVHMHKWGWYPRGGGEVELRVRGDRSVLQDAPQGFNLIDRGELRRVRGLAVVTQLPSDIPQRMANRAESFLREAHVEANIQAIRERGVGPGAGIFLTAEYEHSLAGFGALGRLGLPAEQVADMACQELLDFHRCNTPVDEHLADQLLLPAALISQPSQYRVAKVSTHLRTNAWVIQLFDMAQVTINEVDQLVTVEKH